MKSAPSPWRRDGACFPPINLGEMDTKILLLANTLAKSNPEAQQLLKKVFWEGTENWDTLLADRASMSGRLVLSDFTVNAINSFKAK